jgi:hypothetical protein
MTIKSQEGENRNAGSLNGLGLRVMGAGGKAGANSSMPVGSAVDFDNEKEVRLGPTVLIKAEHTESRREMRDLTDVRDIVARGEGGQVRGGGGGDDTRSFGFGGWIDDADGDAEDELRSTSATLAADENDAARFRVSYIWATLAPLSIITVRLQGRNMEISRHLALFFSFNFYILIRLIMDMIRRNGRLWGKSGI